MHVDSRKLEANTEIQGDICIIGAGTAGIAMALQWINTPYKVILLESGGFEYEDRIQDLGKGTTSGQKYYPLRSSRLRFFGGTTGHWAGMCSPYDNIDFIKRDWVPNSGWPITRADMDPFYKRAHQTLQLGPYEYDLKFWQKEYTDLNPFPLDDQIVWNKIWHFSNARFNKVYKDTITKAKNIHLYTYANVVNLQGNEAVTDIKEVAAKNYAGKTIKVQAKQFVMACGAIQNARLLLACNSQAPKGLGNDNDVVGRYFMEHLEITTSELWLSKPFPTILYDWPDENDSDPSVFWGARNVRAELAITEAKQREEQILNGTLSLNPLAWAKNMVPRMESWQDEDPRKSMEKMFESWAQAGKAAENEKDAKIQRAYGLDIRMEQAPNPNSRVTIGPDKDEFGVPLAHLHWELTELDKRSVRTINYLIGKEVGKAGFARVKLEEFIRDETDNSFPDSTNGGWHHMGTTRMSDDPKQGVVTSDCQVHGINNLFVAGSGCYSTAGAPNPTLTLVALTLRLTDHIKERMINA